MLAAASATVYSVTHLPDNTEWVWSNPTRFEVPLEVGGGSGCQGYPQTHRTEVDQEGR